MLLQDAQVRADYLRPGKAGRDDKHDRVGGTHDHASRRATLQGRTIHDDEITETAELLKMLQVELGFTPGRQPRPSRDHLQAGNRRYGDQQCGGIRVVMHARRQAGVVLDAEDLVECRVMHGPVHQHDRQAEFRQRCRQVDRDRGLALSRMKAGDGH